MRHVEHVMETAVAAFKQDFEAGLRKKLMAEAEQQVEHMVREISAAIHQEYFVRFDQREQYYQVEHKVTYNAR